MSFRENDIIILLGAGCSADAGFFTSKDMVNDIERLIDKEETENGVEWGRFKWLYYCIKSLILYGDGIRGIFGDNTNFNIERLVNVLDNLENRQSQTLYPFVGGWVPRLEEVVGNDFRNVRDLRKEIVDKLQGWVTIDHYQKASYYTLFYRFQAEYQYRVRVFTLNYDLCMEKNNGTSILERGFDDNKRWAWGRFEYNKDIPVDIYLYKMHGSIDWKRDSLGNLTFSEEIGRIKNPDLIFGTNYKLQYIDPFLFFASEFRRYTLGSRLIITVGYGFGDEHINAIIGQALKTDVNKRILVITRIGEFPHEQIKAKEEKRKNEITDALGVGNEQIIIKGVNAKNFMEDELNLRYLETIVPMEEGIPMIEP